jgi:hypothetical protein
VGIKSSSHFATSLPAVVGTASKKAKVVKSTLGSVRLGPGRTMKVGQAYDVKIELVGLKINCKCNKQRNKKEKRNPE